MYDIRIAIDPFGTSQRSRLRDPVSGWCPSFPVPPPLQLILHPQLGQGPVPRDSLAPSGTRSLCPPMALDPITSMPHLSMLGRVMLSRMRPLCTANLKGNPTPGWLSALCPRVLVPGLVLPHPPESPSDPLCLSFPACKQASSHPCSHRFLHRTRRRRLGCCFYQSGRTPTTIQAELALVPSTPVSWRIRAFDPAASCRLYRSWHEPLGPALARAVGAVGCPLCRAVPAQNQTAGLSLSSFPKE